MICLHIMYLRLISKGLLTLDRLMRERLAQ